MPVPIRYGLRKMADRDALDEEDAIGDYAPINVMPAGVGRA